jgi:hypothetical protein
LQVVAVDEIGRTHLAGSGSNVEKCGRSVDFELAAVAKPRVGEPSPGSLVFTYYLQQGKEVADTNVSDSASD